MKADYVHKDTLTATDYVELNKNNELLMSYNQELLKENQKLKEAIDKVKFAIKTNCIKNDKKYEEICCDGDYLLQILEDKEVE